MDTRAPPGGEVPALVQLRQATSDRHHAVEQLLALDSPVSMARYQAVLGGFAAFLTPWEAAVETALPTRLRAWLRNRCRGGLVLQDLSALGAPLPAGPAARLCLASCAAAFGSLYVLEGSALGGQVIARRMAASHGLDTRNGAACFAGHGARTAELWREFLGMLEEEVGPSPRARQEAVDAARDTFDALLRTFQPLLHEPAPA